MIMSLLVFIASGVAICAALFQVRRFRERLSLPPDLSSVRGINGQPWAVYATCARSLGPLIALPSSLLSHPVIIINEATAASDLLEKRRTFACRPRSPMGELLGRQDNVGFTYYGDRLKKMRKIMQGSLNANAVSLCWKDHLNSQSLRLLGTLFNSSDAFLEEIETNVQELIVSIAYGRKPDPEYIQTAKVVMQDTWEGLQPRRWTVNSFPALIWLPSWMPGAGFKRWAQKARNRFITMTRKPFEEVKRNMADNNERPCFVQRSLENLPLDHTPNDEHNVMCASASLFSAGSDTVTAALHTFVLLMARNVGIQERAFGEIVRMIGSGRLPGLEDRDSLPFIDALIQEIHRFHPAVPLAVHSNYEEENYQGLRIPRKTWIQANIWAMTHSDDVYPEPDKFSPDRFMTRGQSGPPDPRTFTYGFGRRRCPGSHLANAILYLNVARILATFKILPNAECGDQSGPALKFKTEFVSGPAPFVCRFLPRSNAETLLS